MLLIHAISVVDLLKFVGASLVSSHAALDNILVELQRVMPEAAHQLLSGGADPFGKHFTTLKLS
ncbi:MAG: hypothetical protein LAO78_19235 [Acidobacteriia bacterium]|nr:hypothetical protein [Terriglobia bacterium]